MKRLMRYTTRHTKQGNLRMYLFTAVKTTLRVGTGENSVNANTHNVSYVNNTQMILESIVLYVPVWFLTALNGLQSTYLSKL